MHVSIHAVSFNHPGPVEAIASTLAGTARAAEDVGGVGLQPDGPLLPDGAARHRRPTRCSRATRRSASWPAHTERMRSACSSPASPTGTRACSPRSSPRSTCCPAAGRRSASAPPGTSASTAGLGVPFPPVAERFERLEETLQICLQMWSDDDGPYDGQALPAGRDDLLAAADPAAAPADPDRRQRRAQDAAAGRAVRRRVQPLRRAPGRGGAQARRAAAALRHGGRDYGDDRQDDPVQGDPLGDTDGFVDEMAQYAHSASHRRPDPAGDPIAYVDQIGEKIVPGWPGLDPRGVTAHPQRAGRRDRGESGSSRRRPACSARAPGAGNPDQLGDALLMVMDHAFAGGAHVQRALIDSQVPET